MSGIIGIVGGSQSFSSASGGKFYGYNGINTVASQVIGGNPQRQKIIFHNPGVVDIYVGPGSLFNTGSQAGYSPSVASPGGCFLVFANGGTLIFSGGEIQVGWQAFCASSGFLTIVDSNIP